MQPDKGLHRGPLDRGSPLLDWNALRDTLRRLAAARDRQPLHTPKNLAMALTVEAAGLAAVFQWMTPEQSRAARGDAQLQQQVAGGVADVLLALVQLADHMDVDLERAVGGRLVEHVQVHPLPSPESPDLRVDESAGGDMGKALDRAVGRATGVDIDTHVLVDWENVQPSADDIRALVPDATDIWLFHGPSQKGVAARHASFGDKATLVKIARAGKNALDFHLSFYMGYIAARHPDARFVVISNDKGYAPMLEHAAELGFSASQLGFVKPAASAAPARRATRRKAPASPVAAKKVTAKTVPATPTATKAPATPTTKAPATKKRATKKPVTPAAPAAKAVARKPAAAKKVAATARPAGATKAADARAPAAFDLRKAVRHVVAGLGSSSRPTRQTKLLAVIRSLLGPSADEQAVQAVLAQLVAGGQVAIDGRGQVRYALQAA